MTMAYSYSEFGDLLGEYLTKKERTANWLARKIKVAPNTVSRWLNDGTRPESPELIVKIAGALELNKDECYQLMKAADRHKPLESLLEDTPDEDVKKAISEILSRSASPVAPVSQEIKPEASEPTTKDSNVPDGNNRAAQVIPAFQPEPNIVSLPLPTPTKRVPVKWIIGAIPVLILIILATWPLTRLRYGLISPTVTPDIPKPASVLTATTLSVATSAPTTSPITTPTSILASILTPTPIPTARPDETLILIATFHGMAATEDEPHIEILRAIQEEIKKYGEQNLRVAVEPTELNADQRTQAEALGKLYNASMVIWGEDKRLKVIVNLLNLKEHDFVPPSVVITTTEATLYSEHPNAYKQFILNDLPHEMAFFALYAVAQSYYLNSKNSLAIERIEAAITLLPSNVKPDGLAGAYFQLGWLYQEPPEKLDAAIDSYNKAIQLKPDFAAAYYNRGDAYYTQNKLNEAIKDFEKAITFSPGKTEAYYNLGNIFVKQNKIYSALACYNAVIQLEPNFFQAYNNRGIIYLEHDKPDDAITDFNKAIQLKPDLAEAYLNRANTYTKLSKLNKAISDYQYYLQLRPDIDNRKQIEQRIIELTQQQSNTTSN